jgi:transcriptional regulator with XRE-family HTH domain
MEAKELKLIVESRGIKQTWIAGKLGVSKGTISNWIAGRVSIPTNHQIELRSLLKRPN